MSFKTSISLFKGRKKTFKVSDRDPTYKVRYLGNVQTSMMKGDGCVDKPTGILWNNFLKTATGGLPMKLCITGTGLKAYTKEQGLTEYRAHRISYCIAHPNYPKLFVWVYRHEGKKMKVELRCHAVLCKTEEKAKAMAVQLHEKLSFALKEFVREKTRRQTTRLTLQRTNSLPASGMDVHGMPLRRKMLTQGGNYKTPIDRSPSAPKLTAISEAPDQEEIIEEEEEEEDEDDDEIQEDDSHSRRRSRDDSDIHSGSSYADAYKPNGLFDVEYGNDVEALRQDEKVRKQLEHQYSDDDDHSVSSDSESGFSEQDPRESSSSAGSNNTNPRDLRPTLSNEDEVSFATRPCGEDDDVSDTASERSERSHDNDAILDDITGYINGLDLKNDLNQGQVKSNPTTATSRGELHVRL